MIDLSAFNKPALQFSGGKDSLACLYLLRDQLDQLTVYWCDTGDSCPETVQVVNAVREWIPNFVEIHGNVAFWQATHGKPVDLVPARSHHLGVLYGMSGDTLSNRFDCCFHNIMRPMHERMLADGVDCVIRGTKLCDTGTVPFEGATEFYHLLLPIRDWTHEQVFEYLDSVGAPKNSIYEHYSNISAPECLNCTAWWDDNKAQYLKAKHPEVHARYQQNLKSIAIVIETHLADLRREMGD